ncbi:3-oxoacyl-[acyl-carrier-protein] synthase III C-terminal domain-containing protein [Streptomyces sp. NPDC059063]|uniref:3-oxoacyl-[acyl-carrier-protein] synthase III C-terminal domain-containing protein n=1 Tax=unclassified Streptomyces TaxID=2593676 RepID=UPI00367FCDDC
MAAISGICTLLPEKRIPVTELDELGELTDADRQLITSLGVAAVRDAGEASATDLAARAAGRLLETHRGLLPEPGAFILVGGRFPELLMASDATRVQRDIGLKGGMALGVSELGCVSVSAALMVARGLLAADPGLPGVLLAHGSRPPGPRRFRRPVTVNGDGAMALYLSREGPLRILDLALETNGEYWDLFQVDYVGRPYDSWQEVCADIRRYSFSLAVESKKRFARLIDELLARQGKSLEDVDHFVMQNISSGAFDFYEQAFDISIADTCRRNLREYGHLGSTDIALNLRTGVEEKEFLPGDLVLVLNNAPVAAWSTMLIEVTEPLPAPS